MAWVKNSADGNVKDYVHVTVDSIDYCVHRKNPVIQYEGSDRSALYLLLNNDKHRLNLADRASIVHRESEAGWMSERPESWTVHYAGKTLKVMWDGSISSAKKEASLADQTLVEVSKKKPSKQEWISAKIKKLVEEGKSQEQAAAIAYSMAREKGYDVPEKKADLLDDLAKNLGKTKDQLTEQDLKAINDQARQMLNSTQPIAPSAPAATDPSMTPPSNTPIAPGQSSVKIRWTRKADSPFSEDPTGPKNDKPADPSDKPRDITKEPKDDTTDDEGDSEPDAKDIKATEKAINLLEKVLKHEQGDGEEHAEDLAEALKLLKEFVGEEESEDDDSDFMDKKPGDGIPVAVDLEIIPDKPGKPVSPVIPMGPMSSSWVSENKTGFNVHDRVWLKDFLGSSTNIDDEAGRVIAIGNGKVVVDWGHEDGIPSEEDPSRLVKATSSDGEDALFTGSTNAVIDEAIPEVDEKGEIEKILSGLSLKDILNKASSGGSDPNAIVHLATGLLGVFLANASDGRCLIRIGNEEIFVYQYEIRFSNKVGGEI